MTKKIWNYIIAFLCIMGGIYLIFNSEQTFSNLVYYIGILILVSGIIKIIGSIFTKEGVLFPGNFLFSGILNIIFGIILMNNANATVKIIPIFIGFWLIISGALGLGVILNIKKRNNTIDKKLLINYILKLILGIIVLTTPIISIVFTGLIVGIIFIGFGIYLIFNDYNSQKIYRVKIK